MILPLVVVENDIFGDVGADVFVDCMVRFVVVVVVLVVVVVILACDESSDRIDTLDDGSFVAFPFGIDLPSMICRGRFIILSLSDLFVRFQLL